MTTRSRKGTSSTPTSRNGSQAAANAHRLLRKVIVLNSNEAHGHLWTFEADRWKELVFALLARTAPHLPEANIRNLVERMHAMRLLDVADLAVVCAGSGKLNLRHERARLILELLRDSFAEAEAQRGLLTICEAAVALQKHFNGKVQRYLRSYGELMLKESKKYFSFSAMSDADACYSLTYWLQNVLSMPLPLSDKCWEEACAEGGFEAVDLVNAADDLDLNLGLLDDLLQAYRARRASKSNQA